MNVEYKYGTISTSQIHQQKKYLQGSIFKLIPLKEEGYECLDARFESLLNQINGYNQLFNEQAVIITIMSLLELARHEVEFSKYRGLILDAVALVDHIEE